MSHGSVLIGTSEIRTAESVRQDVHVRPKALSCACAYNDLDDFFQQYKISHWIQGESIQFIQLYILSWCFKQGWKPKRNERAKRAHSLYGIQILMYITLQCWRETRRLQGGRSSVAKHWIRQLYIAWVRFSVTASGFFFSKKLIRKYIHCSWGMISVARIFLGIFWRGGRYLQLAQIRYSTSLHTSSCAL